MAKKGYNYPIKKKIPLILLLNLFGTIIIPQFLWFVNIFSESYKMTFQKLKKPPLCKGRWQPKADGGVVKAEFCKRQSLSRSATAPFAQGSLFFCSSITITCQFSWQALHLCPQTQNTVYLFRDIPYSCRTVL